MTRFTLLLSLLLMATACKKEPDAPQLPENHHLTMGNPSGATANADMPDNYLMEKEEYILSYHRTRGQAKWVSWYLSPVWRGLAPRQNSFRPDSLIPPGWYQVLETDYSGSGFDRGHLCPSEDRDVSTQANSATFLMTNMFPQAPALNRGEWENLESYCRYLVDQGNELFIVAGGHGSGGIGQFDPNPINYIAMGRVAVPASCWKVILVLPNGTNDVLRVNASTRVIAVNIPNTQSASDLPWHSYRVSVDALEALTGYDFLSAVPADIQSVLEATPDDDPI